MVSLVTVCVSSNNAAIGFIQQDSYLMLHSVLVLIAFQLLGEFVQATFDLPIHGAICGMLMLLVVLIIRGRVSAPLRTTANSLFQYLPLILIPPSVGVMTQWQALTAQPIALGAVIVLSTAIGLAVTAFLFQHLAGRGTKS